MQENKNKYYEFKSMHGLVTLNLKPQDKIPTDSTLKKALEQWCSTKNKEAKIKYAAISKTTKGTNKHVHMFFQLEETTHSRKKPFIQLNNEKYFIKFEKITESEHYDGSIKSIIDYIKKQNVKHPNDGAVFSEIGKLNLDRGRLGDRDLSKALKMPDLEEAHAYLKSVSVKGYMNNIAKFDSIWMQEHDRDRNNRIRIKLQPWKEDNALVKNSRIWLDSVIKGNKKRVRTLVLVSDTKMGKTEFVNDMLRDLKVDEFRGHFMLDGHNENVRYDIRLFDDANLNDITWPEFKSLISTRGEQITINIKYSHVKVTSIPTILVLNPGSWKALQERAKEFEDFDWMEKNTVVLQTNEKLYIEPPPKEEAVRDKNKYDGLDPKLVEMLLENEVEEDVNLDDMGDDTIDDLNDIIEELEEESMPPPMVLEEPKPVEENREKRKSLILSLLKENDTAIVPPKEPDVELTQQARELANRWLGGNFN
ncbi:hypothetical protein CL6EHI_095460 [Entamoeba histolytica]|uniref:Uncharacterized protein n=2 Tax=Entamoeba histolytica TaxID=5759 RepID=C4M9P9_ENTH1|nr:hypothetical protein EHI_095460 [Entamoeba histolytica HM-1:IMSS]EAL43837.2 hypothetical protein EHI_095460 [Entamoeba histolytica HM-1:IMSS]GAT98414.1 hypothetical protein CL6EHI_095460 [Entamoeba histolytica]|eukprot:XP_649223.2 hypothetical protein EHI_095460 [Entamoeba histolytica HM-1:IMSS]